jgi:hypothetical protein
MIRSDKKLKELSILLSGRNSLEIKTSIELLRDEEPFEGAIGLLAEFYDRSEDKGIRETIEDFMNDLKDQSVSNEVMGAIRRPFRPETISMLISSCWQSGLDYSAYARDLAGIFLEADFATAIECMTVIEESVHDIGLSGRNEIIELIQSGPVASTPEKQGLTKELISILQEGGSAKDEDWEPE